MKNKPAPRVDRLAEAIFTAAVAIEIQQAAKVGRNFNYTAVELMAAMAQEAALRYAEGDGKEVV